MKWRVLGVTGAIGLAVLGGVVWWATEIGAAQQANFIMRYKKSFVESCVTSTEEKLAASGKLLIDEMKSKVRDICACGADISSKEVAEQGDMSQSELTRLQNDPAFMEKVTRIMQACNMRATAQ